MQNSQKDFYKKLLGRIGEKQAVKFLKKKGFQIIKTNYKTKLGEIDIIAKDNDTIVFIEVKTRKDSAFGTPAEAVNYKKQQKYFLVASEYLQKTKQEEAICRFDVVEIEKDGEKVQINHIINAFCM